MTTKDVPTMTGTADRQRPTDQASSVTTAINAGQGNPLKPKSSKVAPNSTTMPTPHRPLTESQAVTANAVLD
jgi:hypothetical protein